MTGRNGRFAKPVHEGSARYTDADRLPLLLAPPRIWLFHLLNTVYRGGHPAFLQGLTWVFFSHGKSQNQKNNHSILRIFRFFRPLLNKGEDKDPRTLDEEEGKR